jgi:hypothetical protein
VHVVIFINETYFGFCGKALCACVAVLISSST